MKAKILYLAVACLALFSTCTKSLEIEIVETRCTNFRISNASSTFAVNTCNGDLTGNSVRVNFDFSGDVECLHLIDRDIEFFDENNNRINPTFVSEPRILVSESNVNVGTTSASFTIDFEVSNTSVYDDLAFISIDFNTENENMNESNRLSTIASLPCRVIPPAGSQGTINVNSTNLRVTLRDTAAEDGDLITIIVNGIVIAENVEIFNTPQTFNFTISPTSSNTIQFFAVNEGRSSPNTAEGSVIDNSGIPKGFSLGLNQGEQVAFDLVFSPF